MKSGNARVKGEKWLQRYAGFALICHGVVYIVMSALTLATANGLSKARADKEETVKLIHEQPLGEFLVAAIAISLPGYALLRFFQAFRDTRHKGKTFKGLTMRVSYFFIGLAYLALSVFCFKVVAESQQEGQQKQQLISKLLELPYGQWVLMAIAACFAIAAGNHIYRGCSRKFMNFVELRKSDFKKTFIAIGITGYIARGIVFGIISYMLFHAALDHQASENQGTGGAFDFMQKKFGNILLGIVAAGLFAFGLFMFVRARHEKMNFGVSEENARED